MKTEWFAFALFLCGLACAIVGAAIIGETGGEMSREGMLVIFIGIAFLAAIPLIYKQSSESSSD